MAFVKQDLPDDEKNQFAPVGQTTPLPDAGGSVGAGGANAPQGAPGVGTSTTFGSNASKLSDYLTANAPQVEAQGQKIAGDLTNQYGQLQGSIDQGVQDFGNQVAGGWAAPDQGMVDKAASDPTGFAKDPNNVAAFQKQYKDTYTGPKNFETSDPFATIQSNVNKATDQANLFKTPAGISTYLNNTNPGNETPGMRTLDTALLTGNPNAVTSIQNAAKPFLGLSDYLGGKTASADAAIPQAQKAAADNAKAVQDRFTGPNGVLTTFQNDLTGRVGAARTAATAKTNQEIADIKAGNATPQEMADLKADPTQFAALQQSMRNLSGDFGTHFDPTNYFTPISPESAITPETLGTADDYSKAAALRQLTGSDLSSFLNPANTALAGTAPSVLSTLDAGRANTDALAALSAADKLALQQNSNPDVRTESRMIDIFRRNLGALNPAQMAWYTQQVGLPSGPIGNGGNPYGAV